jgi:hypothetical protein
MITRYEWFYDAQMRRFLEQIVRAFSGFQWRSGRRDGAEPELRMVPCRIASTDRMVAHIMRNLSENTVLTVPLITVSMTGLSGRRDGLQYPNHIENVQVAEREILPDGSYGSGPGNRYTIKRMMPRPFTMNVQVDIWTSNQDQKHQLAEQILTVIYPSFDIQNSDHGIDWSAMTTITMDDEVQWSSRSIPVGTDSEIDIMSIPMRLPFWLNPPAIVTQQRLIHQVVANISSKEEGIFGPEPGDSMGVVIVTPGNHVLRVEGGSLTLLWGNGYAERDDGSRPNWESLLNSYGKMRPAQSRIRLLIGGVVEGGPEVIGTIQYDPSAPQKLNWQIDPDTLPANTLAPLAAIIDPIRTFPGQGLPNAASGRRYLLVNDLAPSQIWGNFSARANDIIEYDGTNWRVVFASLAAASVQHVLNLHTGRQLRWTGHEWVLAVDGDYAAGYWRLDL